MLSIRVVEREFITPPHRWVYSFSTSSTNRIKSNSTTTARSTSQFSNLNCNVLSNFMWTKNQVKSFRTLYRNITVVWCSHSTKTPKKIHKSLVTLTRVFFYLTHKRWSVISSRRRVYSCISSTKDDSIDLVTQTSLLLYIIHKRCFYQSRHADESTLVYHPQKMISDLVTQTMYHSTFSETPFEFGRRLHLIRRNLEPTSTPNSRVRGSLESFGQLRLRSRGQIFDFSKIKGYIESMMHDRNSLS